MRRNGWFLWIAIATLAAGEAFGQIRWSSDRGYGQINQWYDAYLGRPPETDELQQWSDSLRRGQNPLDIQASLLGSDEYYEWYREPSSFVQGLYDVVGVPPDVTRDIDNWVRRLAAYRGDRTAFAREFLAAGGRWTNRPDGGGLGPIAGGDPRDLRTGARQMLSTAQMVLDNARAELAGTRQGQRVALRGDSLLHAADDFSHSVDDGLDRVQLSRSLSFVRRALDEVSSELNNPPGSAPSATSMARRLAAAVDDAERRLGAGGWGGGGIGDPVVDPGYTSEYDSRIVGRLAGSAQSSLRSLASLVERQLQPGPNTTALSRDLDDIAQHVDSIAQMARREEPARRLIQELRVAKGHSQRITDWMRSYRSWTTAQTLWNNVNNALGGLEQELQVGDAPVDPTIPGDWGFDPNDPGTAGYTDAIAAIDRTVAELDSYAAALTQVLFIAPDAARVQAASRQLRGDLLTLRQGAARGVDRGTLMTYLAQADQRYRQVALMANQSLARLGRQAPSLARVDAAMRATTASFDGAVGSPVGPRIDAGLLARMSGAMQQEVSDLYFSLEAFGRYPEYPRVTSLADQIGESAGAMAGLARRGELARGELRQEALRMRAATTGLRDLINVMGARTNSPVERALRVRAQDLLVRADRIRRISDDMLAAVSR